MSHNQLKELVDIDVYPQRDKEYIPEDGVQFTLGDLHGNALTLLYTLTRHGIVDISEHAYNDFVKIYKTPADSLAAEDLERFRSLLASVKVNNIGFLRLIGDEFADRGMNDYYILKIIEKLYENHMPMEILLSNHSADFIWAYESKDIEHYVSNVSPSDSLVNLQKLLSKKLIDHNELHSIIDKCYKPSLKAISYSLNEAQNIITVYTHAGIDISYIKKITDLLQLKFEAQDALSLANTIDNINRVFSNDYVNQNNIHDLLRMRLAPFNQIIWNRNYDDHQYPPGIIFVHGHDLKRDGLPPNVFNLDNMLGKTIEDHKGIYNILYSKQEKMGLKLERGVIETVDKLEKLAIANADNDELSPKHTGKVLRFSPEISAKAPTSQQTPFDEKIEYEETRKFY